MCNLRDSLSLGDVRNHQLSTGSFLFYLEVNKVAFGSESQPRFPLVFIYHEAAEA